MPRTVYLIHGMWCGPWVWDRWRTVLEARGHRCVTATLRHHGVDPRAAPDGRVGTLSLLDYAADLETEVKSLAEQPIILGHSMGGLLAQMLASRGLSAAAVLVCPAAPKGVLGLTLSVVRSFWGILNRWAFWRRPHRQTFERAVYAMLHRLPADEQRSTWERLVFESGRAAFEIGFWLFDRTHAATVDAAAVQCPVLTLSGSDDRIVPASVVRRVAARYARTGTYRELPGHAHWVLAEPGWDRVANEVADWIEQLPAPRT